MIGVIIAIFLGWCGGYQFYKGKKGMGVLYFFTFGLFCIGWVIDIVSAIKELHITNRKRTYTVKTYAQDNTNINSPSVQYHLDYHATDTGRTVFEERKIADQQPSPLANIQQDFPKEQIHAPTNQQNISDIKINLQNKVTLDDITIDVMMEYDGISQYQLDCSIKKTDRIAFIMLNTNNQFVALTDIRTLDEMILDSEYVSEGYISICAEEIAFDYPKEMYVGCLPYSYLEYTPFTPSHQKSKYPMALHFSYANKNDFDFSSESAWGTISYLQDGNIGKARIIRWVNDQW